MQTPSAQLDPVQQRNRELSILNDIAHALNRSADLAQALEGALARVAELFDLQTGWIWLYHPDTGKSYLAAAQNLPPALADRPRLMEGTCYCLSTYEKGDLRGAANISVITCSRLEPLVDGTDGLHCHASIPLYARGGDGGEKKLGVLNVASADWRELSDDDLRLLHTVGDMLSIAVERARLFDHSVQLGAAEERNRLAREIHDTLGQGLAGLVLQLETVDALLEAQAEPERVRRAVQQTLSLTRANLEETRRSVMDLRAAPLEGRTLAQALRQLAAQLRGEGVPVKVEIAGANRPLPQRLEAGLYRICQESLANIARHARARRVQLRLSTTPQQIRLHIEDDGCGFDPDQIPKDRYGLVGLNERARLLDGQLKIESSPGKGTRMEVTIPLEAKP